MDLMTTLGQVFEATANDLCLFDATIKSLIKEFAAGALISNSSKENNNFKAPPELVSSILQKYRQMTVLFLVKLLNHLVIVNNLKVPCSSCGANQQSSPQPSLPSTISDNKPAPVQLLAPVLTGDSRLNLTALTTDTMAAISPLLAAAAALTPPGSGGTCSTDSSSLLATVPRTTDSDHNATDSANPAQQYALLAQQKLAALVQMHQQQQQRQQSAPIQQIVSESSDKDVGSTNAVNDDNNSSEANFDEDEDVVEDEDVDENNSVNGGRPIEVAVDDQPIDFSSHQKFSAVDENRPPIARQSGVVNGQVSSTVVNGGQCQQQPPPLSSGSNSSSSGVANSTVGANVQNAFLGNTSSNALSDALGRVVNRLPVTHQAAAAAVGMFNLGCPTANANDITNAYAKFQSAIASAVSSNHRASIGGAPVPMKTHIGTCELPSSASSPFAALAQHLFPGGGNAAANTAGLLSPAIAGLVQKAAAQQQSNTGAMISPTEPLPLCTAGTSTSHTTTNTGGGLSNRRASLPPYMLSSQTSQLQNSASLVSPSANSSSGGHHHHGSAGVRTADRYRVVYTSSQTFELEQEYRQNKFITITRKKELARQLGLNERQVKIWFQNRRAKDKRAHRRGAESASGGEAGGENATSSRPSGSKKAKNSTTANGAVKEEYADGSAASVGSSVSSSTGMAMNQHDANSNSNNSYDGSIQDRHHDSGGAADESDVDCEDDSCDDMNEEDELAAEEAAGQQQQSQSQQPLAASVVYPTAVRYNSGASVSSSSSSSLSSASHQLQNHGLLQSLHQGLAANALPSLLLATGGSQSNAAANAVGVVVNGNATAMEIN